MKNKSTKVFLVDDEFPVIEEFRQKGIYNSPISGQNLYHLAVNSSWNHLIDLQQLIKDIFSNQVCKEGLVELSGLNTPTKVLSEIKKGNLPDIVIYDWEYPDAPIHSLKSKEWLLKILRETNAFVFVYSKMRDEIPRFLNTAEFSEFSPRFQLFLKGGKIESSFSAEEFILQYVIGAASKSGKIKIDGIDIEFTANNYLSSASDILYLQRILGNQYVLDELNKIHFSIDDASIEKILNDSNGFLLFNEEKNILIDPDEIKITEKLSPCIKLSFLEVVKRYSIKTLEETLERGIFPLIND
tara:strand:+ start:5214 stop:6110 length:897 start_codon:yes stop_codon:yes gene_type:complete